ncbi:hypothetical protein M427DRAFT_68240 [Gonapodya prolifera JEL478]|uniref:Uncharacterized protein n=1 Tax=Gonapodya prolifera (strain JEL478) TaxID=1344416 RepID=A0A139ALT9_GONPJ|nr:hypothetical protein M427DRAFT_68240 [Gonapodya prolifera JEL478]|eukprot:KXS17730.1 hypothetical protein M427DRAFT_68240 [Gonapodya prolifera JEL478]
MSPSAATASRGPGGKDGRDGKDSGQSKTAGGPNQRSITQFFRPGATATAAQEPKSNDVDVMQGSSKDPVRLEAPKNAATGKTDTPIPIDVDEDVPPSITYPVIPAAPSLLNHGAVPNGGEAIANRGTPGQSQSGSSVSQFGAASHKGVAPGAKDVVGRVNGIGTGSVMRGVPGEVPPSHHAPPKNLNASHIPPPISHGAPPPGISAPHFSRTVAVPPLFPGGTPSSLLGTSFPVPHHYPVNVPDSPKRGAQHPNGDGKGQTSPGKQTQAHLRQTTLMFDKQDSMDVADGREERHHPTDHTLPLAVPRPRLRILPDLDPQALAQARTLPELHPISCPPGAPGPRSLTLPESVMLLGVAEFLEAWGGEVDMFDDEDEGESAGVATPAASANKNGKAEDEEFKWGVFRRADAGFASLERLLYQPPQIRLPTLSALYGHIVSLATSDNSTITTLATSVSFAGMVEVALATKRPELAEMWRSVGFPGLTPVGHVETLAALVDIVVGTERFRTAVNNAAEAVQDFSKHRWARARRRKELEQECLKKFEEVDRLAKEIEGGGPTAPDGGEVAKEGDGPSATPGESSNGEAGPKVEQEANAAADGSPDQLPPSSTRERAEPKTMAELRRETRRLQLEHKLAMKELDALQRQLRKVKREGEDEVGEKERLLRRVRGAKWCKKIGWDRFGRCWWWWVLVPGAEKELVKGKKKLDKEKESVKEDTNLIATATPKEDPAAVSGEHQAPVFGVLVEDQEGPLVPSRDPTSGALANRKRATPDVSGDSSMENPAAKKAKVESGVAVWTASVTEDDIAAPHPTSTVTALVDLSADPPTSPAVRSRFAYPPSLNDLGRVLFAMHDRGQRERALRGALEEELERVGIEVRWRFKDMTPGEARHEGEFAFQRFSQWLEERGRPRVPAKVETPSDSDVDVVMGGGSVSSPPPNAADAGWAELVKGDIRRLSERSCEIMGVNVSHAHAACDQATPTEWCAVFRSGLEARFPPRNSIRAGLEIMDKIGEQAGPAWTWERVVLYLEEATTTAEQIQRRNARDRTKGRIGEVMIEEYVDAVGGDALGPLGPLGGRESGGSLPDMSSDRRMALRSSTGRGAQTQTGRGARNQSQTDLKPEEDELDLSLRGYTKRRAATKAEKMTKEMYVTRSGASSAEAAKSTSRSRSAPETRVRESGHASHRRKPRPKVAAPKADVQPKSKRLRGHLVTPPRSDDLPTSETNGADGEDDNGSDYDERKSHEGSESDGGEVSESGSEASGDTSGAGHYSGSGSQGRATRGRNNAGKPHTPRKPRGQRRNYAESSGEESDGDSETGEGGGDEGPGPRETGDVGSPDVDKKKRTLRKRVVGDDE